MIFSKWRTSKGGFDAGLAERIKEDLVSTLRKKGIRVVDVDVNLSRKNFCIQIQGTGLSQ